MAAATLAFRLWTNIYHLFFRLRVAVILIEMRTFTVLTAHCSPLTYTHAHRNSIICLLTLSEIKLNNSFCFGQHSVPLCSQSMRRSGQYTTPARTCLRTHIRNNLEFIRRPRRLRVGFTISNKAHGKHAQWGEERGEKMSRKIMVIKSNKCKK